MINLSNKKFGQGLTVTVMAEIENTEREGLRKRRVTMGTVG